MRRSCLWIGVVCLLSIVARPAWVNAGNPHAETSDIHWQTTSSGSCSQPFLCPGGDRATVIDLTIRDQFNAGWHASASYVYAEGCALYAGSPCVQVARIYADASTDGSGHTTITVPGGAGFCQTLSVYVVHVAPILLRTLAFSSPDYTADGTVDLGDLGAFADSFNRSESQAGYVANFDFDCSGMVGLSDLGAFADHYGHACH